MKTSFDEMSSLAAAVKRGRWLGADLREQEASAGALAGWAAQAPQPLLSEIFLTALEATGPSGAALDLMPLKGEALRGGAQPSPERDGPASDRATGQEEGVQVAFLAPTEETSSAHLAPTVVVARVVGDALFAFRGRFAGREGDQAPSRRATSGGVLVEVCPSDFGEAANISMRHPDLGTLSLRAELRDGRARVFTEVASRAAAGMLRSAEPVLRQALEAQGVALVEFRITVKGERPVPKPPSEHVLDREA